MVNTVSSFYLCPRYGSILTHHNTYYSVKFLNSKVERGFPDIVLPDIVQHFIIANLFIVASWFSIRKCCDLFKKKMNMAGTSKGFVSNIITAHYLLHFIDSIIFIHVVTRP